MEGLIPLRTNSKVQPMCLLLMLKFTFLQPDDSAFLRLKKAGMGTLAKSYVKYYQFLHLRHQYS